MTIQESIKPSTRANRFKKPIFSIIFGVVFFILFATAAVSLLFSLASSPQSFSGWGILNTGGHELTPTLSQTPSLTSTRVFPLEKTRTPYQPKTYTPTPSKTPTATATFTSTASPSPTQTISPTDTPIPATPTSQDSYPVEADIGPINGYAQTLPLSCEARSAVDFAGYFGFQINELDFQYDLPITDNPNTGFVGDPRHERGQTPPRSYGVHAAPVAALLRAYGLNAFSYSGVNFNDIRREIASGRPVLVWVIGNVWRGSSEWYTASDGEALIVAPYEHTVIVTAYSINTVTVLDGDLLYVATIDRFLDSWSVLGNMAILIE